MKNKKALIIGILLVAVIGVILYINFSTKDTVEDNNNDEQTQATQKTTRGSLDDPNSNINKLLAQDTNIDIEIPEVETAKLDSSYNIKYTDVPGTNFLYKDYSASARQYCANDSFSGVYVLNVLGRACEENNIELGTMVLGEDLVSSDPNYTGVCFESLRYRVSIFFKETWDDANVKIDIIG